jgi:hypothetical protein
MLVLEKSFFYQCGVESAFNMRVLNTHNDVLVIPFEQIRLWPNVPLPRNDVLSDPGFLYAISAGPLA